MGGAAPNKATKLCLLASSRGTLLDTSLWGVSPSPQRTSLLDSWYQGCLPYVKISHNTTPRLQTSLSVVNFLYMMLSGGIQRMGSIVWPPTWWSRVNSRHQSPKNKVPITREKSVYCKWGGGLFPFPLFVFINFNFRMY